MTLEHFQKIVNTASLLTEADGNTEKEKLLCETAFTAALLTVRPLTRPTTTQIPYKSKRSKNPDIGESKGEEEDKETHAPPVSLGNALLGFEDELVFSEFVEALAKLALLTMQTAKYVPCFLHPFL